MKRATVALGLALLTIAAHAQTPANTDSSGTWVFDQAATTENAAAGMQGGPVIVDSTRTMWLDEQGRLVIERTGTPRALVPSSRSVYRKP